MGQRAMGGRAGGNGQGKTHNAKKRKRRCLPNVCVDALHVCCTCAARCVLFAQVSHALQQHMMYTALIEHKLLRQTRSCVCHLRGTACLSGMHLTQVSRWVSVGSAELSIDADTLPSACQQVTAAGEDLPTSAIV